MQIFIGFTQKLDSQVSHSYGEISKILDSKNMGSICAGVILTALESHGNEVIDWHGMVPKQKEAAKELMVLAMVAESAVPLETEVSIN